MATLTFTVFGFIVGRRSHTSSVLQDGSIVLLGGFSNSYSNEVWKSSDGGSTWTLLLTIAGNKGEG
jgi:hypothetical protein